MTSKKIEFLRKIADGIQEAKDEAEQITLLTQGFEVFSEETERLDLAYRALSTQFKAMNQKLEETNERLSNKVEELHVLTRYLDNILVHMAEGLLFIDLEGNITTFNQEAEALLEKKRQDVLYQNFEAHFPDDLFGFSMQSALKDKKAPRKTFSILHFADGRKKEIEVENTLLAAKEGENSALDYTEGLIVLFRDITELRRLQMIASRNDRMKALGEMAAQVAHEIRNPLGGIKGFASLLKRDLKGVESQEKLLGYILEGTETLERLVADVLTYSRPLHLDFKPSCLDTLIKELVESLKLEGVLKEDVVCTLDLHAPSLLLLDSGMVKSAVRNLILNAIQAMPSGGALNLSLTEEEGKARLDIQDTGVGIPEEHMKKLFSPFFTTKADGNGLGLAEAHKVITGHGGEISVKSTPGKGTCFTLKIPLK